VVLPPLAPAPLCGPIGIHLLRPDPDNARKMSATAALGLGNALEMFGDLSGIVWNQRTGLLVAGHQRVKALLRAGAREWERRNEEEGRIHVPGTAYAFHVRIVDWEPERARMANLIANNPHIQGEFTVTAGRQLQALRVHEALAELELGRLLEDLEPKVKALDEAMQATAAESYGLMIECESETEQRRIVELLLERGLKCRALI
jgi:hypothetical protein